MTATTATAAAAERRYGELLAVVAGAVAAVEPELPAGAVAAALDGIGRLRRPRLAAWLLAHPDALVSGASAAPKVVAEFIGLLQQQQGASRLVLPACAGCGRAVELFHTRGAERICRRCYNQGHTGICADCGQQRPIAERTPTGQPRCGACHHRQRMRACVGCGRRCSGRRCSSCRRRDPATWQPCGACGRLRPVNAHAADGTARLPGLLPAAGRHLRGLRADRQAGRPSPGRPGGLHALLPRPAAAVRGLWAGPPGGAARPQRPARSVPDLLQGAGGGLRGLRPARPLSAHHP